MSRQCFRPSLLRLKIAWVCSYEGRIEQQSPENSAAGESTLPILGNIVKGPARGSDAETRGRVLSEWQKVVFLFKDLGLEWGGGWRKNVVIASKGKEVPDKSEKTLAAFVDLISGGDGCGGCGHRFHPEVIIFWR